MRLIDADALLKGRDDHEMISTHLIWNAPTIEPNLILPERMERGECYEVGETIVVLNHDDYYDLLCRAMENEPKQGEWIPCSERLPSEEERKEWIDNNLDGIGYLYPCLVTRYSSINPDRTKNNPYVAKHYFDGEDFVNCGEEVCSEYILALMPLPEPWKGAGDEASD